MTSRRATWVAMLLCTAALSRCTCIDLKTPRAYPCTPDGGEAQCPEGWRCGLEGQCHAQGEAAAYECASDNDCEASWRCGPDGRCVDAEAEGLRPISNPGPLTATLLSPRMFRSQPSHVAFGPAMDFDAGCNTVYEPFVIS